MTFKYIAHCKKWHDKINGNTYFSIKITDVKNGKVLKIPFTCGYGEQYKSTTLNELYKKFNQSNDISWSTFNLYHNFIYWIDEQDCRMRDVKNWGRLEKHHNPM